MTISWERQHQRSGGDNSSRDDCARRAHLQKKIEIAEKIKSDLCRADMNHWGEGHKWYSAVRSVIVELIGKAAKTQGPMHP